MGGVSDNQVTLAGNVTRDPELRFTGAGIPSVGFGLAVNRRWIQNGVWQEQASFFEIVAWGPLAENVAESVTKGQRVLVSGRLDQRSWETPDGERRSKVEIVAEDVAPSLRWATAEVTKVERREGLSTH